MQKTLIMQEKHFNPRSRVGNDWCYTEFGQISGISIHVPAWGTTVLGCSNYSFTTISIHVPAWGTTSPKSISLSIKGISIHVPAWGTTETDQEYPYYWNISIHVPAWGTTLTVRMNILTHIFQSTFPRGERRAMPAERRYKIISIHVPAWGTTKSVLH